MGDDTLDREQINDLKGEMRRRQLRREVVEPHAADCASKRRAEQDAIVRHVMDECAAARQTIRTELHDLIRPLHVEMHGIDGDGDHNGLCGDLLLVKRDVGEIRALLERREQSLPAHMLPVPAAPKGRMDRLLDSVLDKPAAWVALILAMLAAAVLITSLVRGNSSRQAVADMRVVSDAFRSELRAAVKLIEPHVNSTEVE